MTAPDELEQVEAEHNLQAQLLRDIEAALRASKRDAAFGLLEQLWSFTEVHFASEQVLMRMHSYPRYYEHERQHGALLDELRGLRERMMSDEAGAADHGAALRQWLSDHIATADRAFMEHVQARKRTVLSTPGAET